jgi:OOP family OmpA-OmpF porin
VQKADNFLVILDTSGSMGEAYKEQSKFHFARDVASRLNQTIPDLELTGALRTLGQGYSNGTALVYGPKSFEKAEFAEALDSVKSGGKTPLAAAINGASTDLEGVQGTIALIILSDGEETEGSAIEATKAMKSQYGDRLCVYPVVVGDDPRGKALMEQIASAGECGYFASAEEIYPSGGMATFAENVFLEKAPPPVAAVEPEPEPEPVGALLEKDSDGDGVLDDQDECPDTPKGATVNSKGCWSLEGIVLFDFDKYDIKPEAYPLLNEVVAIVKKNPQMRIEIQGHTDNVGSAEYNLGLSERRAKAVADYMVENGIASERLSHEGYGLTNPIASNDTKEGRAQNRRAELKRP